MPSETIPVLTAVTAISLLSVLGALVLLGRGWVKSLLPLLIALAAGALLGDTFLHLLPHAVAEQGGFTATIAYGVLAGLLGFFLIEGVLHWHHHGEDVHDHGPHGIHSFGWMNLIGDGLHNLIDGMLIAGAWLVSPEAGLATTIAVALHEIPQEFGDFGVLLHAGFSAKKAILLNLLSGLAAVLGAVFVLATAGDHGLAQFLVPVAAGGFLYIACADLVPEMRKRARGTELISTVLALLVGLGLMVAVHELSGHDHDHDGHGHGAHDHHDHSGHQHGPAKSKDGSHTGKGTGGGSGQGTGKGTGGGSRKGKAKDGGHGHAHDDGHDHDHDDHDDDEKKRADDRKDK